MNIKEILEQDKLGLSFEVFPPKTDTAFESVKHATEEIAKLHPSFMSVTYGAGGGTSKFEGLFYIVVPKGVCGTCNVEFFSPGGVVFYIEFDCHSLMRLVDALFPHAHAYERGCSAQNHHQSLGLM